jgi:Na+-transporting NADH:ubiquinone oxidoreductase subunit F
MKEITLGVALFTVVVMLLVFFILAARSRLVPSGDVQLLINDEKTVTVPVGGKLLSALADADLFLASACGGGGTCAQCRCKIL